PARLSAANSQSPEKNPFRGQSTGSMWCLAAHQPDSRRASCRETLRDQLSAPDSKRLLARVRRLEAGGLSYCRSSWWSSSSSAVSKIVPSNSPVFVKSAGALEALRNTAAMVAVIVRLPDAPAKRPVPPLI